MVMDQNKIKIKHLPPRTGLDSETRLVIKLPDPRVIQVVSRSVFLALVFITFPCIGSFVKGLNNLAQEPNTNQLVAFDFEQFDLLLRSLAAEDLLRKSHKVLMISPGVKTAIRYVNNFHADQTVVALDSASEAGPSSLVFDETFDFVYTSDIASDGEFVHRMVKIGGVVAFPLNDEYEDLLKKTNNYKIVYLRRYLSTIVAMRKTEEAEKRTSSRRLLQTPSEDFEEVLLEPPRRRQWNPYYPRKIKLLPRSFGRRVFVNVGPAERNRDAALWFNHNYPKMMQEFEVYELEVVAKGVGGTKNDVSSWLSKNVSEKEYVVMKAEAEVVVEMLENKTIHLVDELFLECNNQWWKIGNKRNKSMRAYWECLALYGRVKDEGVSVHQWWG